MSRISPEEAEQLGYEDAKKFLGTPELTFRDWLAINATDEQIARFRGAYDNPAGGFRILYKHSIEKARYLYADAMLEARK